jgi:hypothetical protein
MEGTYRGHLSGWLLRRLLMPKEALENCAENNKYIGNMY